MPETYGKSRREGDVCVKRRREKITKKEKGEAASGKAKQLVEYNYVHEELSAKENKKKRNTNT